MTLTKNRVFVVTKVSNNKKQDVSLDEALDIVGLGRYNLKCCLLFALFLIAGIIEVVGYSYVLPSARCDLNMEDSQRGLISSIPYIVIVLTSFPWGYLVDTRGRKPILILSSIGAGVFGMAAAFMPNLITFTLSKLLGSLCLACPAAVPYAYIGEILPQKHRDLAMSITNAMQLLGSTLVPLLAWLILPLDFSVDFGLYYFRPWRLLTVIYSVLFLVCALFMCFGPESPKYLIIQGRHDEAYKVLQTMYASNKQKSPDQFPVSRIIIDPKAAAESDERRQQSFILSLKTQSVPLLKPPYLKWMVLNGFLLFGIFNTLNGLTMWVPDVLNRVFTGSLGSGMTACEVIGLRFNETNPEEICIDKIDEMTFKLNSATIFLSAIVTLLASLILKIIGKKALIVAMYLILGTFCISINLVRQDIVFAMLLSSLQISALGIGPINAFSVQIFPTEFRGMAVSLTMMMGRTGSVVGINVAGILINAACEVTFYLFGGLLLVCGLLTFLLPKLKKS